MLEIKSLFDLSVEAIFKHPKQLGEASLYLPQKISHYLLYLACYSEQFEAVEKIVEHWPHQELNFNFYSNPLCRLKRESEGKGCLEAHEYFNFCTEELSGCIPSIAIGLFWKISANLNPVVFSSGVAIESQGLKPSKLKLEVVDLTSIRVTTENNGMLV